MSEEDSTDEGDIRCPICRSIDSCKHQLFFYDVTFGETMAGVVDKDELERMIAMEVRMVEIRRESLENIGVRWSGSAPGSRSTARRSTARTPGSVSAARPATGSRSGSRRALRVRRSTRSCSARRRVDR